jgi:Leucine-rich repeat (LRR) protein
MDLDLRQIPGTSQLEYLRLSGSGLRSLTGISRASKLKTLHVTNNHISTIPTELYRLASLESLFLSFNAISGTISRMIGGLSNLKEFYVFGNRLTGTIPTEVAQLEQLTDFVVANNYLSGMLPIEFSSMSKLEQLSVYDQQGLELITGPVPSFSQAPNLWYAR